MQIQKLVEEMARALVDDEEAVRVSAVEGTQATVFELEVATNDIGKVIGRDGRNAKALRNILAVAGSKAKRWYTLIIIQ